MKLTSKSLLNYNTDDKYTTNVNRAESLLHGGLASLSLLGFIRLFKNNYLSMKKSGNLYSVFLTAWLLIMMVINNNVYGQPDPVDTWLQINDGFAKCPEIGESGATATWYRDNFVVKDFVHKDGIIYAYISYKSTTSIDSASVPHPAWSSAPCGAGLYQFNEVREQWKRVAGPKPYNNDDPKLLTNGRDIIALTQNGQINIFDETQPTGWRPINSTPLTYGDICIAGTPGLTASATYNWDVGNESCGAIEFIGDTIFVYQTQTVSSTGSDRNYDVLTGINYIDMGIKKRQLAAPPVTNCLRANTTLVDHIAGRFILFSTYQYNGNLAVCKNPDLGPVGPNTPGENAYRGGGEFVYVWDPSTSAWINLSDGPYLKNPSPNSTECAFEGGWFTSWDKKKNFSESWFRCLRMEWRRLL